MEIAVNTRLLLREKLEGIGWFTCESLKRITRRHPEHHFTFIFDRPYDESFIFSDNITPVIQLPQARHPLLFRIWFDYSLPPLLRRLKPDLFLSPDGYLPLRSDIRSLAVIHDLNFEHYPDDLPPGARKYYLKYFPLFSRKATRIATVSEFSKQDIVAQYHINPNKIDVVYDGGSEAYIPLGMEEIRQVRNLYSAGAPYFIFIGSLHPRKNLLNLFLSFDLFKKESPSDVKLLIVGEKKWWTEEIEKTYNGMTYRQEVIFCGRKKLEELTKILGAALALTYVSYFEGFGIPIVEAFRCGVPVITSNATSMPEVAGEAALFTDPFDPSSIASAMRSVYKNEALRKDLIIKGFSRKDLFTWDRTADLLWQSIINTIESN